MTPDTLAKSGTEHGHQRAIFQWCAQHINQYPDLAALFAIHNAGHGDRIRGARAKAEGVKAGVPDLFLPVPRAEFHGLFIELKRPKDKNKKKTKGNTSTIQDKWHDYLRGQSYGVAICFGWQEAVETLVQYLEWKG